MTSADLDENDPVYKAIDKGGGQTCDIAGVMRELVKANFVIMPLEWLEALPDRQLERLPQMVKDQIMRRI